jgi:hypothetical protein
MSLVTTYCLQAQNYGSSLLGKHDGMHVRAYKLERFSVLRQYKRNSFCEWSLLTLQML